MIAGPAVLSDYFPEDPAPVLSAILSGETSGASAAGYFYPSLSVRPEKSTAQLMFSPPFSVG